MTLGAYLPRSVGHWNHWAAKPHFLQKTVRLIVSCLEVVTKKLVNACSVFWSDRQNDSLLLAAACSRVARVR